MAWRLPPGRAGWFEALSRAAMMDAEPLRNPANILISVVIPAFHEADSVLRVIRHASTHMQTQLRTEFIVAVVDDETAQRLEESELPITVVRCSSGRSSALNAGAALARGEVLLFVHADCLLPRFWDLEVRTAACREGVVIGAFRFGIDCEGRPPPPGLSAMARFATLRSQALQLPYGDQAIFVRKDRFHGVGGFGDMPLMEDFDFVRRLRRAGMHASFKTGREHRVHILPLTALCSVRRWERKGVSTVSVTNQAMLLLHIYAGVSPNTLYRLYYGRSVR
ncbi:nucleotide-diphospho-sugar transferase [Baffinella frigidus]|nr:nucleotide-diphospho-sugar transferase [Cryptophyta sp. CCMP2293]